MNGVKISPLAAGNYKKALRASLCPKGFCVFSNRKWLFAVLAAWVFATPALAADKPKLVDGGKLQPCYYSGSQLLNHTADTITIYGRRYKDFSPGVHAAFTVKDDSEIHTDYIVNEHIRVEPTHPLYGAVRVAMLKADEKITHKRVA